MSADLTPGERRDLRTLVKQRMKLLRTDIEQRKREMIADGEAELLSRYQARDEEINRLGAEVSKIIVDANLAVQQAIKASTLTDIRTRTELTPPRILVGNEERTQLHQALIARVNAQAAEALLTVDRQETTLLQTLIVGALQSDAARDFLNQIPTAAELVPGARLAALEAAYNAPSAERDEP